MYMVMDGGPTGKKNVFHQLWILLVLAHARLNANGTNSG